jgi:hypothetical protein
MLPSRGVSVPVAFVAIVAFVKQISPFTPKVANLAKVAKGLDTPNRFSKTRNLCEKDSFYAVSLLQ